MSNYFDRAIEALQFCCELDSATIDVVDDNGKVLEKHKQGQEDEVAMLRAAIRVLEAANLILPLVNTLNDGMWYRVSFSVKNMPEGLRIDGLSAVAALPATPQNTTPDVGQKESK